MKDIKSLLLVLLSVGLVGTWVYHLYDKTLYSKQKTEAYIKDSIAAAEGIRDSLQKIYSATINKLDTRLTETKTDADSLKAQLDIKLGEIYKLRNEIGSILKNRGATKADMALARQKIAELQQKVDELRDQNSSIEEERNRLNTVLEQLAIDMKGLEQNIKQLGEENKSLTEKVNLASLFVASELRLSSVAADDLKEEETSQAKKVSKFIVSLNVQNNINDYNNAEVIVIVTQPDGQVLQNDIWESGSFDTRNEGRRSYTMKMRFEYHKGESRHLIFSLNADNYQKGNYTMQVYHNAALIGRVVKTLN